MLRTPSVTQVATSRADLYAFRIAKKVSVDDMEAMAEVMNAAFDAHDNKVDMLLIIDRNDGVHSAAGWNWNSIKSRFRAITNLNRYVVVGAPDSAAAMIEAMGRVLPVEAEAFDSESAAWRVLGAEAIAA